MASSVIPETAHACLFVIKFAAGDVIFKVGGTVSTVKLTVFEAVFPSLSDAVTTSL